MSRDRTAFTMRASTSFEGTARCPCCGETVTLHIVTDGNTDDLERTILQAKNDD